MRFELPVPSARQRMAAEPHAPEVRPPKTPAGAPDTPFEESAAESGFDGGEDDIFEERPSVLDPTTGFKLETTDADFEGWIVKQSTWRKEWRRRYMMLKGTTLFFSKDERSVPHQVRHWSSVW